MALICFLCYFSGSSPFITVKLSGMYLFFLKDKEKLISLLFLWLRFRTFWGLPDAFSGCNRMEARQSPTAQPSCSIATRFAEGLLDVAGPSLLDRPSDKVTKRRAFSARASSSEFPQYVVHFSCRTVREKGNTWTSTMGLLEEGTVSERKMRQAASQGPCLVLQSLCSLTVVGRVYLRKWAGQGDYSNPII